MAALAPGLISVEQYLRTVYRPDRDYVDGKVQERYLGERDHAAVQMALGRWFSRFRQAWNIAVLPEIRVQVSPTRFRVPDICLLSRDLPREQIITHPPLLCVEVLSPEDRPDRVVARAAEFLRMGVPAVWIIDPATAKLFDCREDGLHELTQPALPGTPIYLDLDALFADLD